MKTTIRTTIARSALTALVTIVTLAACNNPLQVGLGEDVDIDRPVVSLESPDLGSFLRGTVTFTGEATDDVGVTNVSISFDRGATWTSVEGYSASEGRWSYALDTTARANGRLGVLVRVTDNAGKQATTEELLFTIDNEAPNIFFIFPAVNPDNYDENNPPTVGKNGAVFGTVTDRDAIGLDSPSIKFWRAGDPEPTAWTNLRPGDTSTPSVYDFKYNIPTEQVGEFSMKVRAVDVGGQVSETPTYRVVIVSGAPQVDITSPNQADYTRGTAQIAGTMSHETGQEPVITLEFHERDNPTPLLTVAKADGITVTPNGNGYTWTYDLDTAVLPDGTIIAQTFAQIGDTTGFDSVVFNVDNEAPTVTVTSPGYKETVYSTITLRGIASDNATLEPVSIKIGADPYDTPGDSYNWSYSVDTNLYGNTTHAEEWDPLGDVAAGGTGIWRLPIFIRALDSAGNETIEEHVLFIDQDLDKPTVNVLSPLSGSNLAGPVLVTGTAFDADPGVSRVEMQIIAVSDADDEIGYLAPDGSELTSANWHVVDGTSQWSREINSNGLLYSVTDPGRPYEASPHTHNGRLRILVRAVDAGGKEGNVQTLPIRLDETIPTIANVSPASNSYVTGSFSLTADISDDEEITSVAVSYDGGTTYDEVYDGAGAGQQTYDLNVPINTTVPPMDILSESRNLRIRVRDNANYTTITTVTLNIDNYWPDGALDTIPNDPENMSGSSFELRGEAWDRDTGVADNQYPVRGVESIEVYFEDRRNGSPSGDFYSISGGTTATATLTDLGNGQVDRPVVGSADHKIVITRDDVGSVDGRAIEPDGPDSVWYTLVDSTRLPDGQMQVHYLVTDRAGNRTHRSEPGFVRNNLPSISSIVIGTDLNGDSDTVDAGERTTFALPGTTLATNMTARNNALYVEINAEPGANDPVSYSLQLDGSDANLIGSGNSILINTMAEPGGTYEFDGTYSYLAKVIDAVGIEAETTFTLHISNTDGEAPTVTLSPITSASVVSSGMVELGHVEAAGESTFDGADPDVSGTIMLSGSVSDNQIVNGISIEIDGFAGGAPFTVASWNGTQIVSDDPLFTITSQSLTEADGHEIDWTYEWDSAQIASRAARNVTIAVSSTDLQANSGSDSAVVDVVPYITSIANSGGGGVSNDVLRSSTGKYSVDRSNDAANYLIIEGFNFDDATLDITITAAPVSTPGGISVIAQKIGTATSTSISLGKDFGVSGYLTLFVGPASVPSINNINTPSLAQTLEDDPVLPRSAQWTDDRYLHVFELTQMLTGVTNSTFYYPTMIMDGNQPVFTYTNDNAGSTQRTTSDTTTERRGFLWYERQTAVDRDDDGGYYITSVQDAFSGGDIGYLYVNRDRERAAAYGGNNRGNHVELIGEDYVSRQLNRFRYPRINVDGSSAGARLYVSVYDAHPGEKDLKFFAFQMTGATATNLNEPGGDAGIAGNGWISLPGTQAAASSQYFDLVVIGDATTAGHKVVIPYYDETAATLKLIYAVEPVDGGGLYDGATQWYTIDVESPGSYAGTFVSGTTDGTDVYLAYYDSGTANLRVAHVPGAKLAAGGPGTQAIDTYTVDSYLSVGTWTNIELINGTPYVSYYSDSYNGTRSPIRLAYPLGALSDGVIAGTNLFSGTWEVIAVPTLTAPLGGMPQFNRTQIGQYTVGTNMPVLGWLGSKLEYAKLRPTP